MKLSLYSRSRAVEIRQLFNAVFTESEGEEQGLSVSTLAYDLMTKTDPDDVYGFTAVDGDNRIVGSIFFSKLLFESQVDAYILSPVAIATECQGTGIGVSLLNFGIDKLREKGTELLFTYGSPEYYSKVGFKPVSEEVARAPVELSMPFGWLGQSLVSDDIEPLTGRSRCVDALANPEYW